MAYTKKEVVQKFILAYKTYSKEKNVEEVPVASIIQKTSFKQDERNEIFNLFNLNSYEEILLHTNLFDVFSPQGKPHKVVKMKQTNAPTEEKTMAVNETKSESLHDRIKSLRDALTSGLYEKDEAVRLALLTAIAGESIFFLGAPGCAKSMIARRVVQAFKADGDKGVKYFETLLNQFSTPEEVFGNISLKALNGELEDENGNKKEEYRRLTENMLPEADIAFLDEIWKASPAILNTLLTIINERKFHNGSKVMDVPLKALFAASNEFPAKDRGLEALYDRFILRLCVGYIENEDSFFGMIDGSSSSDFALPDEVKNLQITNEELKAWKEKIDAVSLSEEAKAVISAIRKELTSRNEKLT
ncbi:MAG: AAA family ATPase, partial [Treponema sp.]|nr:AAA family ATPase [Treponema sp.]